MARLLHSRLARLRAWSHSGHLPAALPTPLLHAATAEYPLTYALTAGWGQTCNDFMIIDLKTGGTNPNIDMIVLDQSGFGTGE